MKLLKFLLPVAVLGVAFILSRQILSNPPEVKARPTFARPQAVDAISMQPQSYQVILDTQGTIEASTSTTLVAEVAGTIQSVSPKFVTGGAFKKGELLIQLDQRDYQIALTQARAQLSQAEAQLQEEFARGKQAKVEWESLHRNRKPTALNLRTPQLAAARANRDAARAQVERADLDMQRTQIIAPYDGRVSVAQANLGQFVSRGNMLGEIYSVGSFDVRLPLTSRQQSYLDTIDPTSDIENVILHSHTQSFAGRLVRIEGVDSETQQFNVIAQIKVDAKQQNDDLRVGKFIQARITGKTLNDVYVVPRQAIRQEAEVLVLENKKAIQRQAVTVAWRDETHSVISSGLVAGQHVVVTPLSVVANGTPVSATIDGKPPERGQGGGQRGGNKKAGVIRGGDAEQGAGNRSDGKKPAASGEAPNKAERQGLTRATADNDS